MTSNVFDGTLNLAQSFLIIVVSFVAFLPRCMECRCSLAMRILSVCLSVL